MLTDAIENDFQKKVSAKIRLASEGVERYRVLTPFRFDDGDHIVIVLKKDQERWLLTDEAHTFMRLTYDIDERDFQKGTRQKIISDVLTTFQVQDHDGELILYVAEERYGDALYSFVQAILKISDVLFLTRERTISTFKQDFQSLISKTVPDDRLFFNWKHPDLDPNGNYVIDCCVNGKSTPLFIQAVAGDSAARDATIALLQFEKWGIEFHSLAIFENQETISRRVLARYSDVCEKQFSSLVVNKERINKFLTDAIRTDQ